MSKFRLCKITDLEQWDLEVAKSPHYSIFANSNFINNLDRKFCLYFVYRGQQVKAALPVFLSKDESSIELDDLCIHNSIMFFDNDEQKLINSRQEQFEITEYIINALDNLYNSIEISLSPAIKDIRPFQWHNYFSDNESEKFKIDTRYTSFLDISDFFLKLEDENTNIFKNLDSKRQTDIKRAREEEAKFIESKDVDIFINLYSKLLESQEASVDDQNLDKMRNLINQLIELGYAKMFLTMDSSNQVTYAVVFSYINNVGCYLYGAGNRDNMRRFDATYCIWMTLKSLSEIGIYSVDLEGVNSPSRGQFKLGFGGSLKSYFRVHKR